MKSLDNLAISTKRLTKRFKELVAVDHITFDVQRGEIFGFLGPNGAGKSTAIRMLCTLSRPSDGTATVAGYDIIKQDSEVRKHIGLVSEKMIMYNDLTARENLKLFGKLYDIPTPELNSRIDELLRFVRMEKWGDKRIGTFSTGMKQRINVIRALLNRPDILFLDEPTLGLDPQSTAEIRELIRTINKNNGTTMILTTHMMTEADMLCDRIGIIDRGKIVALDSPRSLKRIVSGTDTSVVEFELVNLTTSILYTVKGLDCIAKVTQESESKFRVHATGGDCFDSVVDCIRKAGGKIKTVQNLEPSLEDVFLHITGRNVRENPSDNVRTHGHGHGPGGHPGRSGRIR